MNYAKLATSTEARLSAAGMPMTLRVTAPGTYDPSLGARAGDVVVDHSFTGVMANYKTFQIDGTLVQAGDMLALLGASSLSVEPEPGAVLIASGEAWDVKNVKTIAPGGVAILHKVQVRKA